jgi:predicted Zn-dependent protease
MIKRASALALRTATTAMLLLIGFSCAVNPVTGKKELMLMTEDQEIALGVQSDPEIVSSFGEYQDPALQAFISAKGKEMAAISHRPGLDYQFKILDSPVVNAFALPGGFVYFTRGIMAHFSNEAEFAGVLGHEIGHITARHGARQYTTQMASQLGLVLGVVLSQDFAQFADLASNALGMLFLKFSRDHETESDRLGVEYSTKIGYDAREMAGFFQTLKRLSGDAGAIPTFLSTHPDPVDRYANVGKLAAEWQQKINATDLKIERNAYLRMIDGIVYGEDPRHGYLADNVFYHPELRFQFPTPGGWKMENMASQVQFTPEDGKALLLMDLAAEKELNAAAEATLAKDSLRTVDGPRKVTVHGSSALSIVAEQTNPNSKQTIRIQIYLIQFNDRIYRFYGMSYQADFDQYKALFLNTMQNFKALNDPSRINVQPERIRIREVASDASLRAVLNTFGVPEKRWSELAIVNGMELDTQVPQGTLIKILSKE